MKFTHVIFGEDGPAALYADGELEIWGDEYHDRISVLIDGFFEGLNFCEAEYDKEVLQLNEKGQEKFADDGYEVPQTWPDKKWKKYVEKYDY